MSHADTILSIEGLTPTQAEAVESLVAENQQLRDALEQIADVPSLKVIWAYRTDQQMGRIAQAALDGTEDGPPRAENREVVQ